MMKKDWIRKTIIILGWLLVWQLLSLWVDNQILLAGPVETVKVLFRLLTEGAFWKACLGTLLRISMGFLAGTFFGILLAVLSARHKLMEEILAPPMTLIKAVPVASFVVIFLIWWGAAQLATVISFCIVLPNLYVNTLEGMKSTDKRLLEMAQVFELPVWNRFFYIYRPALRPFWDSAMKLAVGMSWKSGVAAEVIGLPANAIGEQLYMSKIYLDTSGVLAWTIVIILLSTAFERGVLWLWSCFCRWEPACKPVVRASATEFREKKLCLKNVTKEYHGDAVLKDFSAEYVADKVYLLNSPSGSGKTTLLRLVAGLEQPDEGFVERGGARIAFLFQEDRLCEEYSALKNVEMVTGKQAQAREWLEQLLEQEDLEKPCRELSGGMKRRVALARALAAEADILLLDEPYTGLDEVNREKVRKCISENTVGRIVLLASHVE